MMINLLILVFGIVANLFLGLTVFVRNRKSATNILFFLFSIDIVIWSIVNYFSFQTTNILLVLYLTRIVMALAVPQAVIFFLLIHTLPNPTITLRPLYLYGLVTAGVLAMVACVSPYLFPSVIFINGMPSPTPGPAMPLFIIVAIGSVLAGMVTLLHKLMHARGALKLQLEIILVGVVAMFTLIVFFNFVLVVFFSISSYVTISVIYTLPFVAATGYAIIRHKFLDIRPIVARAVSYTVLISLIAVVYALVFSLVSLFLTTGLVDYRIIIISTAAAIVMLLTFPFFKRTVEKVSDSVFYKNKYNPQDVIFALTEILARYLKFEDLTHELLLQLNARLHISRSCIVLFNQDRIFSIVSEGYNTPPEIVEALAYEAARSGRMIMADDIHDERHTLVSQLGFSVVVPLSTSQQLVGILGIGDKLSGDVYTKDDLSVLDIISPEAAVAIENSLSYEEIRRFNITLEDEVEHATKDLKQANTKLQQLDKMKDEFVSLASHELRTPLTSIRSYLWMALSGKGGEIPEKERQYLAIAFDSASRLIKLVNDMLNISRIESGRLSLNVCKSSIEEIVQAAVKEVQPKITEQKLTMTVTIPSGLPAVIADPDKIREVIINFLGNAIKFTQPGGSITISAETTGTSVVVHIADSGIGIKEEDLPKLFNKFITLTNKATVYSNAFQSTGLGLYLNKSIIEMHEGHVMATSSGIGKGSVFSFTLPIFSDALLEVMRKKFAKEGLGLIPYQAE